jgi:hypothetical protein
MSIQHSKHRNADARRAETAVTATHDRLGYTYGTSDMITDSYGNLYCGYRRRIRLPGRTADTFNNYLPRQVRLSPKRISRR